MATARDLIEEALLEIGVLSAGETATSRDAELGLTRLNRFLNRLQTESASAYTITRTTKALTPSDGTYSVGSGGDFNINRPIYIERFAFQDTSTTPNTEYPLRQMLEQEWQNTRLKTLTSTFPTSWYYNPTDPLGTVEYWPVPTSGNLEGIIYYWEVLTTFAALTTTVTLPPGYEEMLVTNLALLLCPSYERVPNPVLVDTARRTLADIKRNNTRMVELQLEVTSALRERFSTAYDIYRH